MYLYEYVNEETLRQAITADLVKVQRHPNKSIPLDIYTYTRRAVLDNIWNEATIKCRALIVNRQTKEIVARSFEKFFNINDEGHPETLEENLPSGTPAITEKLDGSLGVFWKYGTHWGIASKGSFDSDHSRWATKWLENHIEEYGKLVFPEGYTPVFEMICEDVQHHVVHYGKNDLVLLALVNNETGEELFSFQLYAEKNHLTGVHIHFFNLDRAISQDRENAEGYVASWRRLGRPPLKVKIKHPTFLKYQKILHKASPKAVLQLLKMGDSQTIDNWVSTGPKHIAGIIDKWRGTFTNTYLHIQERSSSIVTEALKRFTTRKEFALFFLEEENKYFAPVCFALLDTDKVNKHREVIWKLIEKSLETDSVFSSLFDNVEIGD